MGHVVRSWFIRACAQSRATDASSASEGVDGSRLASLHNKFPRSNVYGVGLSTVTELEV